MTNMLPPIPENLKPVFVVYISEFKNTLKVLTEKNSEQTFVFSEKERQDFQQRFHRLKGSSGFFKLSEIVSLAQEGELLFSHSPNIEHFPKFTAILSSLDNAFVTLDRVS